MVLPAEIGIFSGNNGKTQLGLAELRNVKTSVLFVALLTVVRSVVDNDGFSDTAMFELLLPWTPMS
jgi:hypothetical protein